VQTYAFMGTVGAFREFLDDFPGEQETERLGVIDAGEIGLSGRILNRGGALTCLAWPEYVFDKNEPTSAELPHRDIKEEVRGLPFQYRARVYTVDWWRNCRPSASLKQFFKARAIAVVGIGRLPFGSDQDPACALLAQGSRSHCR
jgi:hypothetical protein